MSINEEQDLHTGEVVGSIPTAPTRKSRAISALIELSKKNSATFRDATKREHDDPSRGKSGDFVHGIPRGPKVYFITDGRLIKIGYSEIVEQRLVALQSSFHVPLTLLAVTLGTMDDERALHARFANLRVHGEWFRPGAHLLKFIEDAMEAQPIDLLSRRHDARIMRGRLIALRNAQPHGPKKSCMTVLIGRLNAMMEEPDNEPLHAGFPAMVANIESMHGPLGLGS